MTQRGRTITVNQNLNKRVSKRVSEEFVYRQSLQKHIGKRTGNLYRRLYYKQNFDGFPRFSQYQSHHKIQLQSLANSFQFDSKLQESCQRDRYANNSNQKCLEEEIKLIVSQALSQNRIQKQENNTQRKHELGIEQFFSTIKKQKSITQLTLSQIKEYNNLIQTIENNNPQQFQFNQQGIQELVQAMIIDAKQDIYQQVNKQINIQAIDERDHIIQKQSNFSEQFTTQLQNSIRSQTNRPIIQRNFQEKYEKDKTKNQIQRTQLQEMQKYRRKQVQYKRRRPSKQRQGLVGMKCGSKYCILSQQKQYLKQLYSQEKQKRRNERYPKRTRMKPVQYWQNEKVRYKKGKAVRIQRSTLNMKQLISTRQGYENKININFTTHNIEIQVRIPPKKQLRSAGICDLYQKLQISLLYKMEDSQVYYQDHIRRQQVIYQKHIQVPNFTQFFILNRSRKIVDILIKMIVKKI